MQITTVKSSELLSENRWDAGFHITKQSLTTDGSLGRAIVAVMQLVDPAVPENEKQKAAEAKAVEIMMNLPPAIRKRAVKDLVRGNSDSTYNDERAIKEYPFMALAIAFRDLDADKILKDQITELQSKLDKISGLSGAIKNKF